MNIYERKTIMFISALTFSIIFNEIFMSLWTRNFWNAINFQFYVGVNMILLAIDINWGISWHEQLYGGISTPITIKQAIQRLRSVI